MGENLTIVNESTIYYCKAIQCKIDLSDEELDDLELPVVCGEVERGAAVHRRVHVEARRRGQLADAVCKVAKVGG